MTDTASYAPFTFTDEHGLFRDAMRGFARSRFAATYHARAQSETFPETEYRQLVEQGLLGLMVPEHLGGQGADPMAYAIAMEELSWADITLADLILLPTIVSLLLTGSEAAEEAAAGIADGSRRIGLCLTEPGGGSDSRAPRHARRARRRRLAPVRREDLRHVGGVPGLGGGVRAHARRRLDRVPGRARRHGQPPALPRPRDAPGRPRRL